MVLSPALLGRTDGHYWHRHPAGHARGGALETYCVVTVSCLPLGFGSVSSCAGWVAVAGGFGPSVQVRHDLKNIHGHSLVGLL